MSMKRMAAMTACALLLSSMSVQRAAAQQPGGQAVGQAMTQQESKPQQAKPQQATAQPGQAKPEQKKPPQAKPQSGGQPGRGAAQRSQATDSKRGNVERAAQGGREAAERRTGDRGTDRRFDRPGRGRLTEEDVRARMRDLPADVRRFGDSNRMSDRVAVNALARGVARGMPADEVTLRAVGDHVRMRNRQGDVLLDLSDARARELGAWHLRMLGDRRATGNAPSFCRSGAGHPVWGRQWCLDKGFGLGSSDAALLWSRGDVRDVIFGRRVERDRLERPDLLDVVGDIVFGRLALHALTLGFTEPLTGLWIAEPNAPQLLRVQSGGVDVAELVDLDRDNRVDVLFVAQYR